MSLADGLKLANQYFEQGNYRQSESIYSAILRIQPGNFVANKRIAAINESFGRFDAALEFYKNALKRSPIHLEFLTGYIRTLIKKGSIVEAKFVLNQTKTIYEKAKAFDQLNSLSKQLKPSKKLEFFYKYLE
ncbi:tetratricopeptide repeat protein, partial [Prochlorococcus sp. MIT 1303]|uniref:tetratricopeptide repeat protein n=1 Tax=Prochlorococcus sp. MIT 1303 TaxID=1723647 RepID=UPI000B163AAB